MSFLISLLMLASVAFGDDGVIRPSIVGNWQFYMKVYQGQEMPEGPGATLRLHFDFDKKGVSRLYWWHVGEGDHCYREGKYSVADGWLSEEVTWVDPANTSACSEDQDMQLGKKTNSPISFRGPDLVISFHLGDEPLDFVWKKLNLED